MAENPNEITYFAETDFRNKKTPFGIRSSDRSRHMYIIGKTGMGKSTLLENLAVQDIKNGHGLAFIDPHGKSAEMLLDYIPKERIKDVIYFAPHDVDFPVSFNVMEDVGKDQRHLVANGLMSAFKKIWPDVWSARMEYISMNIILALLEYPDSTLLGINRMLSDKVYRKKVVDNVTDPSVKAFWVNEFAKYSEKIMVEAGASIQNKFGQFSSNPLIRNIIGQTKSSFSIRDIMDNKKIFIANLSKGRMGEINSNLIGGMLITKIYLGAMSRANVADADLKKLPNFYLYVDEFQSFVNDSFADILSEARKYKLNLTIAHQYIEQMPETVRNAVFGNVGTTIAFRVGPFDAEVLEKIFAPKFVAEDIVNLGFAQIYLTLMIDGVGSQPFSAKTQPPIPLPPEKFTNEVIDYSRSIYSKPRFAVEEEIKKWHEEAEYPEKPFDKTAVKKELETIKKDFGIKEFPPKKTFIQNKETVYSGKPEVKPEYPVTEKAKPVSPIAPYVQPVKFMEKKIETTGAIPPKVSLHTLKNKEEDKKATGVNLGDLKNVLAQAFGAKEKGFSLGHVDVKKEKEVAEPNEKIIDEVAEKEAEKILTEKKEEQDKKPREVPEEVLRKVLDSSKEVSDTEKKENK